MKAKVTIIIAKGILLGALLIAAAAIAGCTTITTTLPDGTVTVTKGADPATAAIIAASLSEIAQARILAEK